MFSFSLLDNFYLDNLFGMTDLASVPVCMTSIQGIIFKPFLGEFLWVFTLIVRNKIINSEGYPNCCFMRPKLYNFFQLFFGEGFDVFFLCHNIILLVLSSYFDQ